MRKQLPLPLASLVASAVFTILVLAVGFMILGWIPALLFFIGYAGGFGMWISIPVAPNFHQIRWPYFLTLGFFMVHKWEERHFSFFPALSEITGVPVPEAGNPLAVALYLLAGAWLLIPILVTRSSPFGLYLTWTFFVSMGVIELAHFIFPFFTGKPYGYFPGMASVIGLAPASWWGLKRLWQSHTL